MQRAAPARSRPLRAAVVGSGGIAREHLGFLSGRSPIRPTEPVAGRINLVGVCDLSEATARFGADEFGAADHYTDLATMLDRAAPDVVHVLTPPETHRSLVQTCLESGAHVICEKPITPTRPELVELLGLAEANDRQLMESQNYRFNRPILEIGRAIEEGRLGPIHEVEIRVVLPVIDPAGRFADRNLPNPVHRLPAGVVHDMLPHMVYLLLELGRPLDFDRVAAAWSNHSGDPLFTVDDLDALAVGHNAAGPLHARLRFDARGGPDAFVVRARGSQGWIETDLFQPYLREVRPRPGGAQLSPIVNHLSSGWSLVRAGVGNVGRKVMQHSPYEGLHRMLDESYRALAEDRPLPVSPTDMLDTAALIDRLVEDRIRL